ncbi:MAG TPA: hypothetical protein PKX91_01680 [Clostridia bacterium]|jgi:hypothetical protein|nr:hypothetical protein [Clostridia bacterium]
MEQSKGTKYHARELFNKSGLGDAEVVTDLGQEGFYQTFLVKTKENSFLMKIANDTAVSPENENSFKMRNSEIDIYKTLAAAKVNVPKIVYIGNDENGKMTHYILSAFDTAYPSATFKSFADRGVALFQAGADLAKAHKIRGQGFGYEAMGLENDWAVAYKALVDNVIADAIINDTKIDIDRIYAIIERARPFLTKVESSLVHFSLTKGKVFVKKNGSFYQGISGWSKTIWGDPAGDFIPQNGCLPVQKNRYFIRGYKSVNPSLEFTYAFQIRVHLMMLYLGLVMLAEPDHKHEKGSAANKKFQKRGRKYLNTAIKFLENPFPDLIK